MKVLVTGGAGFIGFCGSGGRQRQVWWSGAGCWGRFTDGTVPDCRFTGWILAVAESIEPSGR